MVGACYCAAYNAVLAESATVTLDAGQAEAFVRSRKDAGDSRKIPT